MRFALKPDKLNRFPSGFLLFLVILALSLPQHAFSKVIPKKTNSLKHRTFHNKILRDDDLEALDPDIQNEVWKYFGIPYRTGGVSLKGVDCSGLTQKVYADLYGVELPHNSSQQSRSDVLESVPASVDTLEPTDLLFFSSNHKRINHVGIYLSGGKFLHSLPKQGVVVSDINSPYWQSRLVASKRLKSALLARTFDDDLYPFSLDGKDILFHQNISLGYAVSPGSDIDMSIEAFLDRDIFAKDETRLWPESRSATGIPENLPLEAETWQGIRAFADFHPLEGLRITPSFSIIDAVSLVETSRRTWQAYGIEAAVSPRDADWSLVVSLRSLLGTNLQDSFQGLDGSDMGLRLNYRFSDAVRVTVLGSWEGIGAAQKEISTIGLQNEARNVSFNLGLSF